MPRKVSASYLYLGSNCIRIYWGNLGTSITKHNTHTTYHMNYSRALEWLQPQQIQANRFKSKTIDRSLHHDLLAVKTQTNLGK